MSEGQESPRSKMYVWRGRPGYLAVAFAMSVAEARDLMAKEMDGGGDESTPVRNRAAAEIQENMPEIFMRSNAEFVLTNSGELEEMDLLCERKQKEIKSLKRGIDSIARTVESMHTQLDDALTRAENVEAELESLKEFCYDHAPDGSRQTCKLCGGCTRNDWNIEHTDWCKLNSGKK